MTLEAPQRWPRFRRGLAHEIARLGPWFHNLHLPSGVQTAPDHPLGDFPAHKWRQLAPALPADLSGWTALDVGCNAGFYSFELARRGADVLAIDKDPRYVRQASWAARQLGLEERVRIARLDVYALARLEERFDLVLFMGLLYHLRHPLLGLDLAVGAARRMLVVQTLTLPGRARAGTEPDVPFERRAALAAWGWPRMSFVEHRLAGDPTNWWVPDRACAEAMMRSAGLEILARPAPDTWLCRPLGGEAVQAAEEELRAVFGGPFRADCDG